MRRLTWILIAALASGIVSTSARAGTFDDESPEMKRFSVISKCSRFKDTKTASFCMANASTLLGEANVRAMLGVAAASSIESNLDVAERVFTDLLREKTLNYQVQHMVFRDHIDLANRGDAWDVVDKAQQPGGLNIGSIHIDSACTARYPNVERQRKAAVDSLYFTYDKDKVREKNAAITKAASDFVIGGADRTGAACLGRLECASLGDRAILARDANERLTAAHEHPDLMANDRSLGDKILNVALPSSWHRSSYQKLTMSEDNSTLAEVLQSDPALNELVELEPGECAKDPKKEYRKCYRAYDAIAGAERTFRTYHKEPSAKDIADHRAYLSELYQQANQRMKERVLGSIRTTCDPGFDAGDMVMAPAVARAVLQENPGFEAVYCRLLQKKLTSRKWDERTQTALTVVGWTAVGAGFVASIISGGTAAPLALSVAAGGSFTTSYKLKAEQAHEDMLYSVVKTGAGYGDPRDIEYYKDAEDAYRKQFRAEIITTIATLGIDAAILQFKYLRNAGKITEAEEELLEAEARRVFGEQLAKQGGKLSAGAIDVAAEAVTVPRGVRYSALTVERGGKTVKLFDVIKAAAEKRYGVKFVEGEQAAKFLAASKASNGGKSAWGMYLRNMETGKAAIYIHPNATIETVLHEIRHAQQYRQMTTGALRDAAGRVVRKPGLPSILEDLENMRTETIAGKSYSITTDLRELDVELWQYGAMKRASQTEVIVNGTKMKQISERSVVQFRENLAERYVRMAETREKLSLLREETAKAAAAGKATRLERIDKLLDAVDKAPTPRAAKVVRAKVHDLMSSRSVEEIRLAQVDREIEGFDMLLSKTAKMAEKDQQLAAQIKRVSAEPVVAEVVGKAAKTAVNIGKEQSLESGISSTTSQPLFANLKPDEIDAVFGYLLE